MSEQETQSGLKHIAAKAEDMVGGLVGMASAVTAGSQEAHAFVANACISDRYEIEAAQIALARSRAEPVRAFAEMMVAHHTTAMHQMTSALRSSEVTSQFADLKPPSGLDARRDGMLKHLREAPDEAFDKAYLDQQKLAHQEAIFLHKGYAEGGDNPQLRSLARGGLPMVERHRRALDRLGVH